jgi:hypothetical protein
MMKGFPDIEPKTDTVLMPFIVRWR